MKSVAKGCKIEEVVYQYKTENYLRNQNSSESTFFFVKNYDRLSRKYINKMLLKFALKSFR